MSEFTLFLLLLGFAFGYIARWLQTLPSEERSTQ